MIDPVQEQTRNRVVTARVAEIRGRFLDVLESRLVELEAARSDLEEDDGIDHGYRRQLIEAIRFGAHKTTGIAATVGFPELGRLSQVAELAADGHDPARATVPELNRLLHAVDDMLGEMALILIDNDRC
ncbi:Hpt domain-containing protein [Frigidibacter sp. MR17.14]|uniref:Hpt domain-containing protein n=1 Tax=Frigidibacter sp. MR17.14 TaxID=3126509 RepID=UPI003012FD63